MDFWDFYGRSKDVWEALRTLYGRFMDALRTPAQWYIMMQE
jgi:hypothetical protein